MNPYRVPFTFDRTHPPRYRLQNVSDEPLRGVTVTILGPGLMPVTPPANLRSGEKLDLMIHAEDLAFATILIIRWLRPNGEEYLWRVAF